jgi:hypothetical protein
MASTRSGPVRVAMNRQGLPAELLDRHSRSFVWDLCSRLANRPVILRPGVVQLDDHLSRQQHYREFTTDPRCILRYAPLASPTSVCLSDGIRIGAGELILDLHLWNPHIPPVPKGGPNLAWARRTRARFHYSLQELACVVAEDPDLREARACRARMNCAGQGYSGKSLSHLIERFGFEDVNEGRASIGETIHNAFENILIAALIWAYNPEALRRDKLLRKRRPVWISRERLLQRYGRQSMCSLPS